MLEPRNPNETAQEHHERHERAKEYFKRQEQELELWENPLYREIKYTQGIVRAYGGSPKAEQNKTVLQTIIESFKSSK